MNTISMPLVERWFVGREKYMEEFMAFLRSERGYSVLFLHGPGGIGKTWLLRRMIAKAHEEALPNRPLVAGELIDMYSTAMHSIEGVCERLIALLDESAFENYRKSQSELRTAEREGFREANLKAMRQHLQDDFIADCQKLSEHKQVVVFFDTFERVQRDQVGNFILIELIRALPNFRFVVGSREKWEGNTRIHSSALVGFSPEEAQKYFEKRGWSETGREIMDAIRKQAGGHPLRMELALEFLSGNLLRDADRLRKLDEKEFEEALIAPLQEMGQGLFGSPSFDEAIHQTILFMAYFNRRFNAELLGLFVEQGAVDLYGLRPENILEKLEQEFFFVKTRPDGYIQLHDEMERLVNQYLWPMMDLSGEFRRELARIACQWYALQIEQEQEATALDDLKAEQLVYWLDADLEKAVGLLQTYGYGSFILNNLLVVEIKPEKVREIPTRYRYRFAKDLGDRARRVYLYEKGQEYWKIAVGAARKIDDADKILEALVGLHNCTYQLDLDQSLNILREEALPLCEHSVSRRVQVLYEIGFTLSRKHQYQEAIKHYEQAKEAAKNVKWKATILNDMGYTYVFLGQYKRAARYAKRGLDLRIKYVKSLENLLIEKKTQQEIEQLKNDLGDARWFLGLSFNTLGQIKRFDGDFAAARGAYSEALAIFKRSDVQDFLWQARALHSRGEAYRRTAEVVFEQGQFSECDHYEDLACKDFQKCLDLCNKYGISEKHTAYRRMGRLFHDQAMRTDDMKTRLDLLELAKSYFENGVQAARNDKNVLEELENLNEIAYLVDDRLDALKSIKSMDGWLKDSDIQEGNTDIELLRKAISHYRELNQELYWLPVFGHLLELEEGAFWFVQEEYEKALEFYIEGVVGLAKERGYGVARYKQHLGHLFNQFDKLDQPTMQAWGEKFIKTWEETKVVLPDGSKLALAQLHPELVEEMQIYLDTAFLELE